MPTILTSFNADDIVEGYRSGLSAQDLIRQHGISRTHIYRLLHKAGVPLRARGEIDDAKVVAMVDDGVGSRAIARKFGYSSPGRINRILIANGRTPRNRSQQQFARMRRASPEQRLALASAAHAAVRGRKLSDAQKIAHAAARPSKPSALEELLAEMLRGIGLTFDQQTPIGPYNCDFTSGSVAVEVWGGNWHWHGKRFARCEKRFRYIMNSGWHIIAIVVNRRSPLTIETAQYIKSFVEHSSANPSTTREYRVIWRAGQDSTGGRADDAHFSVERPFTYRRNPSDGRYERVAR